MSSKLRVYEVARELSMDNKEIVSLLQSMGFGEVRNHMSVVSSDAVERLRRHQERKAEPKVVEERIRPTVVKRRSVAKPAELAGTAQSEPIHEAAALPTPIAVDVPPIAVPVDEPETAPARREASASSDIPVVPIAVRTDIASTDLPRSPVTSASLLSEPIADLSPASQTAVEPTSKADKVDTQVQASERPVVDSTLISDLASEHSLVDAFVNPVHSGRPTSLSTTSALSQKEERSREAVSREQPGARSKDRPSTPPASAAMRPSSPPRTGIEVWEGRPGVPMTPPHRGPVPRRVQYDAKASTGNLQRRPGQPAPRQPQRGTRGRTPTAVTTPGLVGAKARLATVPLATERGAHKRVVKIEGSIGLQTLAGRMGIKAHELLRKLITLGMTGVNINSTLDADTAKIVASEFGWEVEDVAVTEEEALVLAQGGDTPEEEAEIRVPRPPVVTVMGHVDHGKTSLLDRIRKANVVATEAGGITQHIGAYNVDSAAGRLTFLDTPGHEAFTAMRARGAKTTDIVVLVVAADDGVMPQTREAINHAKSAKVPIVVAINKCDKPDAQPERVRRELSEFGLMPEEWGGETLFSEVSAQTGKGVDELLERILLQSEMLDLRANPNKPAVGVVIEAQLDRGRGPVATVLITDGTLNRGDVVLAGAACGKVRAMLDSYGRNCAVAEPSTPVEVIGLNDVPAAGDPVHVVKDMKKALEIADTRKIKERRSLMPTGGPRLTLEDLYKAMKETEQLELKVIVKGDVHGSVEAVSDALTCLSTEKVKVTVVHAAAGAITEGDVNLAVAAGSIIIGFNVRPAGKASALAAQEKVEIRHYSIIYNVVDDVKAAMEGLLAPSLVEKITGKAEVRQVFRISKAGNVAGCMVIEGLVRRAGSIRIVRDNAVLWQGKMSSLKRF